MTTRKKQIFSIVAVAVILTGGYVWANRYNKAKNLVTGNDRDARDCIGSAGYSWCEAENKCLKQWGEVCGSADKIVDWKIYKNATYGFEFKYPSENPYGEVNEYDLTETHYGNIYKTQYVGTGQMSDLSVDVWEPPTTNFKIISNEFAGLKLIKENGVIINDKSATESIYYGPNQVVGGNFYYHLYTIRTNDYVYAIYGGLCMNETMEQRANCGNILSTFKFTK